jgi:hypothetical protein
VSTDTLVTPPGWLDTALAAPSGLGAVTAETDDSPPAAIAEGGEVGTPWSPSAERLDARESERRPAESASARIFSALSFRPSVYTAALITFAATAAVLAYAASRVEIANSTTTGTEADSSLSLTTRSIGSLETAALTPETPVVGELSTFPARGAGESSASLDDARSWRLTALAAIASTLVAVAAGLGSAWFALRGGRVAAQQEHGTAPKKVTRRPRRRYDLWQGGGGWPSPVHKVGNHAPEHEAIVATAWFPLMAA